MLGDLSLCALHTPEEILLKDPFTRKGIKNYSSTFDIISFVTLSYQTHMDGAQFGSLTCT